MLSLMSDASITKEHAEFAMRLSIVTALYNSAPYVEAFYNRMTAVARKLTRDYEIIFVNDGSPDESLDRAVSLYKRDKRVRIIDLSRNFGHHKAIMTGVSMARGDLIFLLDSDLEEDPELLLQFSREMKATKSDVVYGVQQKHGGAILSAWVRGHSIVCSMSSLITHCQRT